jgi:hypothetical protein
MPTLDIHCAQIEEDVVIDFTGETEPRGEPAFRGFTCANEAACFAANIQCALFALKAFEPFDPAAAWEFLNS